jgi:hypothetical protein
MVFLFTTADIPSIGKDELSNHIHANDFMDTIIEFLAMASVSFGISRAKHFRIDLGCLDNILHHQRLDHTSHHSIRQQNQTGLSYVSIQKYMSQAS